MKKPFIILSIVVVMIAGVWAFLLLSSSSQQKNPEVKLPSEQTNVPKEKNTISIKDFAFNPDTLTVKVGDTVTWVNEDGVVHSITSSAFNSPNIKSGETFKFQFTRAGTYDYNCSIHPYMKGKVVVE